MPDVSFFDGQYFLKYLFDIFPIQEHAATGLWFKKICFESRNELKLISIHMKRCWHIPLTFLPLCAYPLEQLVKKTRWDFDIQWHVSNFLAFTLYNCTDSFCRCRDFPLSCFPPQSFCHVSPQIKAAAHSRTNCVGIVDKDSAGVKCNQVRPSVPQPNKIQSVDLIHAEEMSLFMQPFQCIKLNA